MITVEQATDAETITYVPRRLIVVREHLSDVEVIQASCTYAFRRRVCHPDFKGMVDLLDGRCYSVEGFSITDDADFWFGRRYNWLIHLYPGCPDREHFCVDSPVPLVHALGME